MQKILGLDIGSYSVKAVEIANTLQGYKVTGFYTNVIPELDQVDPTLVGTTAIKQLFSEHQLEPDRVFTAIMGLLVSTRTLHLTNVKKRHLSNIVLNELEDKAPFPLEEAVVDQQIIDTHDNQTRVLAVLSRKENVQDYLNGLKELGIEPKIIDVDFLSYMNLFPFLDFDDLTEEERALFRGKPKKGVQNFEKFRLILDIGHLKTSLALFQGNKLVATRSIRMGGKYLNEYLARTLNITVQEASRLKHSYSRILESSKHRLNVLRTEEDKVVQALTQGMEELGKEVLRTLYSFRAQDKVYADSVVITGGTSVIQNLPIFLQDFFQLPVSLLKYDFSRLSFDIPGGNENQSTLPQSLAIALRCASERQQSKINLRRGELAFVGSYDVIFKQIANVTILVASLLLCLLASYSLRWWLYGKQIDNLRKDYVNQVVQIMGQEPKSLKTLGPKSDFKAYHNAAIKLVESDIKNKEQALEQYTTRKVPSPLAVLNDVSSVISKDVTLEVTNFSVQGNVVLIEAETDSFASSDKITELFKKSTTLQNPTRKSQESKPGSEGKIIRFVVDASLKEGT